MKIKRIGNTVIGKRYTKPLNTYLTAVGSIANIYPAASPALEVTTCGSFEADQDHLQSDWNNVGNSLRLAFDNYNSESL